MQILLPKLDEADAIAFAILNFCGGQILKDSWATRSSITVISSVL
jgi:hypothetical protein